VFSTKLLLYSLSICYCLMENHFSEVKKTTNSFTYDLQQHWNYGWLYMKYDHKYMFGVTGDDSLVFPAKLLLYSLLIYCCLMERSQKDCKLIYLWASMALEFWLFIHIQHQKSICRVTGDDCLVFPAKLLLDSLSICCWLMENHFSEVKKTSNSFTYEHQ